MVIGGALLLLFVAGVILRLVPKASRSLKFDTDVEISVGQKISGHDEDKTFSFEIVSAKANNGNKCVSDPAAGACAPTQDIKTQLRLGDTAYKGIAYGQGQVDMSFSENGAYSLLPYTVEIVEANEAYTSFVVNIHKLEYKAVAIGEAFTIHNNGIGVLAGDPGTGVHVGFGVCGTDTPCIRTFDAYVKNEIVIQAWSHFHYDDTGRYYRARAGGSVEQNGIRLKLLESDDKTYAKFVFEKV